LPRPNGDRFAITMVPASMLDAAPTWIGSHRTRKAAIQCAPLFAG